MRRLLAPAGLAALGALAVHAAPALTTYAPARRRLLPGLTGSGPADHVALTFDDGPDPKSTPRFLDLLAERKVTATFFFLGNMLSRSPELGREVVAAGHEIALHGYTHRCLLFRSPWSTYADLSRGYETVAEITGRVPAWYRPPYGVLTASTLRAAKRLGMTPVLWSTWGRDWEAKATPQTVFDTVNNKLTGGGTILLHDSDCTSAPGSWQRTLAALPRLLDEIEDRELRVGPLGRH